MPFDGTNPTRFDSFVDSYLMSTINARPVVVVFPPGSYDLLVGTDVIVPYRIVLDFHLMELRRHTSEGMQRIPFRRTVTLSSEISRLVQLRDQSLSPINSVRVELYNEDKLRLVQTELSSLHPLASDEIVTNLTGKFPDVFTDVLPPEALSFDRGIAHTITVTANPLKALQPSKQFRRSQVEQRELQEHIDSLLEQGIMEPSMAPFSCTPFLVPKADGTKRMVVDFKPLNAITIPDPMPLDRIDDLLTRAATGSVLSSIDMVQWYYQVAVDEASRDFTTHRGVYRFRRMSFGLKNAGATFTRVLQPIIGHLPFVLIYLDDVLIMSDTIDQHTQHLHQVSQQALSQGV